MKGFLYHINGSYEEECNAKHDIAETQLYTEALPIHQKVEIVILFKEDTYFVETARIVDG